MYWIPQCLHVARYTTYSDLQVRRVFTGPVIPYHRFVIDDLKPEVGFFGI
jgi:hypothetical protein